MTSSVSKYIWNDIVAFQFQFLFVYLLDLGPDSKFKNSEQSSCENYYKILKNLAGYILYTTVIYNNKYFKVLDDIITPIFYV